MNRACKVCGYMEDSLFHQTAEECTCKMREMGQDGCVDPDAHHAFTPAETHKVYLGDSVYAEMTGGMLKLTTENCLPGDPSNTIFLEPEVYYALKRFMEEGG